MTLRPLRKPDIRGASLIEAMISLAILAIAMLGLSGSLVAATKQDRINDSRAAAQIVANELAENISKWPFSDARLAVDNNYTGAAFASPVVEEFTLTRATDTDPSSATDKFDNEPDHDETELTSTYEGRAIDALNMQEPGRTYAFRRYWNVRVDSAGNQFLKMVAVHVTYQRTPTERGVATAYTAVYDRVKLTERFVE